MVEQTDTSRVSIHLVNSSGPSLIHLMVSLLDFFGHGIDFCGWSFFPIVSVRATCAHLQQQKLLEKLWACVKIVTIKMIPTS